MLNSGDVFAGFTIERLLGQGGMGSVYLARHPRLGKLTALKLLNRELVADREIRARFDREADLVAQLDHPSIVEIYDRGVEDGMMWISMQFIDGVDAASVDVTQLPPDRAVQIIEGVAAALDYAHAMGVLHRDVKPANIILARAVAGHGERVFLTDFGIARLREDSTHLTQTGMFTATLAYASPEQMTGGHLDHTSDQYSLACALYWLLIGAGPFDSPHPAELIRGHLQLLPPPVSLRRPGLTPAMDAVLTKGMAKRAIDRFPSCTDFAKAARRALTAPAPTVQIPSPPQQSRTSGPTYRPNPAAPQPPGYAPPNYAPQAYPAAPYPPQANQPGYPPQAYPPPGYAPLQVPPPGYVAPQQPQPAPVQPGPVQQPQQGPPQPAAPPRVPAGAPHQPANAPSPQAVSPVHADPAVEVGEGSTDVYPIDAQQDSPDPDESDTTAYPIETPPGAVPASTDESEPGVRAGNPRSAEPDSDVVEAVSDSLPAAAGAAESREAEADAPGAQAREVTTLPSEEVSGADTPRRPDMTAPYRKGSLSKRDSGQARTGETASHPDSPPPAADPAGSSRTPNVTVEPQSGAVSAAAPSASATPAVEGWSVPGASDNTAARVRHPESGAFVPTAGAGSSADNRPKSDGREASPASDTGTAAHAKDAAAVGAGSAAVASPAGVAPAGAAGTAAGVEGPAVAGPAGAGPVGVSGATAGVENPPVPGPGSAAPAGMASATAEVEGPAAADPGGVATAGGTGTTAAAGGSSAAELGGASAAGGVEPVGAGAVSVSPAESTAGEAYWGRGAALSGEGSGATPGTGGGSAGRGFATGEMPAFTTGEMPGFVTGEFAPYPGAVPPGVPYPAGPYGNAPGTFGPPTPPRAQPRADRPGIEQSQVTALVVLALAVVVLILLVVVVLALTG